MLYSGLNVMQISLKLTFRMCGSPIFARGHTRVTDASLSPDSWQHMQDLSVCQILFPDTYFQTKNNREQKACIQYNRLVKSASLENLLKLCKNFMMKCAKNTQKRNISKFKNICKLWYDYIGVFSWYALLTCT